MLTAEEIIFQREQGNIIIEPWSEERLNPNSYNLELHSDIILYGPDDILDIKVENPGHKATLPEEGFLLQPGWLLLGRTVEYTETHNLIPCIEGRSSTARCGLTIHNSAGFGDIGYCGTWTLEMSANVPIKIYPHIQVCQLSYYVPIGKIDRTYKGKYQNAQDALPSRLFEELGSV